MAHNARIRANLAAWGVGSLAAAELDAFDQAQFEAGNLDDGGTWAPAAVCIIGGAGISVTGPTILATTTLNGTVTAAGSQVTNIGTGGVGATINLQTGSVINALAGSGITLSSTAVLTCSVGSIVNINGPCGFDGVVTFKNGADPIIQSGCTFTWQSGSLIQVDAGATINLTGAMVTQGASTFTQGGLHTRSGTSARTKIRTGTVAAAADATISVDVDHYRCDHTGGVTHTWTALVTTAPVPQVGEVISATVVSSGAGGVNVRNEGVAGNICSGVNFTFEIIFNGTVWKLKSVGGDGIFGAAS